jgi:hypothetical protein
MLKIVTACDMQHVTCAASMLLVLFIRNPPAKGTACATVAGGGSRLSS